MKNDDDDHFNINGLPAKSKKELYKIGEAFAIGIVQEAIRSGYLDAKRTDHVGMVNYVTKYMKGRRRKRTPFFTVIDHRDTILKEARLFSNSHKSELALLLYATWIEHFVNSLVEGAARKKKLPIHQVSDLIRDTPIRAKLSWLLHLLGLPPIPHSRQQYIEQIMQTRNSFVHYKWKFKNLDDNSDDAQLKKIIGPTERIVSYLKHYERRHVLHFSNKQIRGFLEKGKFEPRQKQPSIPS